jgi:hypothetical protein
VTRPLGLVLDWVSVLRLLLAVLYGPFLLALEPVRAFCQLIVLDSGLCRARCGCRWCCCCRARSHGDGATWFAIFNGFHQLFIALCF